MATWYARRVRTTNGFQMGGDVATGYIVRTVLRLTVAAKSATGRDIELHLTVAEARDMARQLLEHADKAEEVNQKAGYRIDLPRF